MAGGCVGVPLLWKPQVALAKQLVLSGSAGHP